MKAIGFQESLTVEFKSDRKRLSDNEIVEAVTAFANTAGGDLYVGIEDDGTITGIHKDHRDTVRSAAMIANKTVPPVSVSTTLLKQEGVEYQLIQVPRSTSIVATTAGKVLRRRLKADGEPENVPLFPFEIPNRLSSLRLFDFSAQPVPDATYEDLAPLERERLRNTIRSNRGEQQLLELTDKELDLSLKLTTRIDERLVPTYTGLLLIGRQEKIAELMPTAESAIQIRTGSALRVNESFSTPLLAAFERIEGFFRSWNREDETDLGLIRVAIPDFDPGAFREALVNAYAHRDYSLLGRVRVLIDDEGITVSNPGGFIEGITIQNLLSVEPQGRNPVLADALKRIGLAERTGRGINRIISGSLLYGRLAPNYRASTASTVSLFIPRDRPDKPFLRTVLLAQQRREMRFSALQLLVLNALRTKRSATESAIARIIGADEDRVHVTLEILEGDDLIVVEKDGSETRFRLAQSYYDAIRADSPQVADSTKVMPSEEKVLRIAREQGHVSRSDIMSQLGISDHQAYYLLKILTQKQKLRLEGKGRYAVYRAL